MTADTDFLQTLQDKEAELMAKLEESPIWKQITGIRSTIELFKNGDGSNGHSTLMPEKSSSTPPATEYPINGSWVAKILFALNSLTSGFVEDIIHELKKHETFEIDDETLYKRISQNCSVAKKDKKIEGVKIGTSVKYYRK
jgi:hypothetical protein